MNIKQLATETSQGTFKKSVLALVLASAVAAPMAAQAAGPSVYGRFVLGLQNVDDGTAADTNEQWDVASGASRFGIKGDEDLGGGLKAFYQYEFSVSADVANINANNRLSLVGFSGGFGSLSIGKQWSAYYNMVGTNLDPLQATDTLTLSPFRVANALKYGVSFGPVNLEADVIANSGGGTDINQGMDRYTVGASFKAGPVSVGLAHDITTQDVSSATEDTKLTGVVVSAGLGPVTLTLGHETQSDASAEKTQATTGHVSGSAGNIGYVVGYSMQKDDDASLGTGATEAKRPFVNVTHNFSKQTRAFVELSKTTFDQGEDNSTVFVGVRKDF